MQQLTAILLRRAWKRQGNDLCLHPSVEPEYEQAVPTGGLCVSSAVAMLRVRLAGIPSR